MKGSVVKMVGGLLSIAAAVVLIIGLIIAGIAAKNEFDNQSGESPDAEMTEANKETAMDGLLMVGISFGVGLVSSIVSIVGSMMINNELIAAAGGNADGVKTKNVWFPLINLGVTIVILAIVWFALVVPSGVLGAVGLSFGGGVQSTMLDEQSYSGSVDNTFASPLQSDSPDPSNAVQEFTAPSGTDQLIANMTWTTNANGGTDSLIFIIEMESGGSWDELVRTSGQSTLDINYEDPNLDGAQLRYRVEPANSGAVQSQPFDVNIQFWSTTQST